MKGRRLTPEPNPRRGTFNRLLRTAVAIAGMGALASCAVSRRPALPMARAETLGLPQAALDRIDPALQAFVDSGKVSGTYAVIARHGQIRYERTFGWMDVDRRRPMRPDAIFRIYAQPEERGRRHPRDSLQSIDQAFSPVAQTRSNG